ncbi:LLM class flavin-dependent oxidoreductase [Paenibacillus endoradicis]|uniref:LLM class flavin-dependent oxidoreductase n=1 Tax=Paenibacillus endoradicis TaxID=2972487 RepID=UPI0021591BF1|nr:LLM class flavin-dependent oxidoreductase [Paenibacillus endoradicis]MCR8655966.1 LLM class flavin-dependent oxidoreductase [Paenibacillus endoradicis]MCR8658292.1 LLM class flavin-dependent oxidoreductase [Paenibacillus endoradicis]
MSKSKQRMKLGVSIAGAGYIPGAWNFSNSIAKERLTSNYFKKIAQEAERAKFDFILIDELHGLTTYEDESLKVSPQYRLDSISVTSSLLTYTEHIGLVATIPITTSQPYHVARKLASLDHLSKGRAAWNVVINDQERTYRHYDVALVPDPSEWKQQAEEFLNITSSLWDSWEDDAIIGDKETGIYADPSKHHHLNFKGKYYSVAGSLNVIRPPQGYPVRIQQADSVLGLELVAKHADILLVGVKTTAEAIHKYEEIRLQLKQQFLIQQPQLLLNVLPIIGDNEAETDKLLEAYEQQQSEVVSEAGFGVRNWITLTGTKTQIADALQNLYTNVGYDGFNLIPAVLPESLQQLTEQLIPELQERGLVQTQYDDVTLREGLGIARPNNKFREAVRQ